MESSEYITQSNSATIGEIVVEDYRKAEIFKKFGLDFCCGGNKTLDEACNNKGINPEEVRKSLLTLKELTNYENLHQNYDEWPLDILIDHIVDYHHKYVSNALPVLDEYTLKVARVHGSEHPEVLEIKEHYDGLSSELRMHMRKEEDILFPYIKQIVSAKSNSTPFPFCPFGTVSNPISMMELEHEAAGGNIQAINELSNGYNPPQSACNTYRVLYAKLQEFENDLHQHIHLENNILFPKAIKLEKEMLTLPLMG